MSLDAIITSDAFIRGAATLLLFLLFALLETRWPRRERNMPRAARWPANLVIQLVNVVSLRALPWIAPLFVAVDAKASNAGLFNWLAVNDWLALLGSIVLLDLAIYWQHRMMHWVPLLWRLHRMHHTDVDLDVTSALRFHPLEIIGSAALKSLLVWCLGAPVEAVLLFALLLNGTAMFNHANLKLPDRLERLLRTVLVTPDMHSIHHSINAQEMNTNFGFNLSCWDRLFNSYTAQPELGHSGMILGLGETNGQETGSVVWMLKQPFR